MTKPGTDMEPCLNVSKATQTWQQIRIYTNPGWQDDLELSQCSLPVPSGFFHLRLKLLTLQKTARNPKSSSLGFNDNGFLSRWIHYSLNLRMSHLKIQQQNWRYKKHSKFCFWSMFFKKAKAGFSYIVVDKLAQSPFSESVALKVSSKL